MQTELTDFVSAIQDVIAGEFGKWFLGGEATMWNLAIERRMP